MSTLPKSVMKDLPERCQGLKPAMSITSPFRFTRADSGRRSGTGTRGTGTCFRKRGRRITRLGARLVVNLLHFINSWRRASRSVDWGKSRDSRVPFRRRPLVRRNVPREVKLRYMESGAIRHGRERWVVDDGIRTHKGVVEGAVSLLQALFTSYKCSNLVSNWTRPRPRCRKNSLLLNRHHRTTRREH